MKVEQYLARSKGFDPYATKEQMQFNREDSNTELQQVASELDAYVQRLQNDPDNKYLTKMVNYLKREYNKKLNVHYQGLKGKYDEDDVPEVNGELLEEASPEPEGPEKEKPFEPEAPDNTVTKKMVGV